MLLFLQSMLLCVICKQGTVVFTWIGNPSIRDDLCEEDAKRPDIRFDGEGSKVDSLWSCPFDGELGT